MSSAISGFRAIAANLPSALERTADRPEVRMATERFRSAIDNVRSIDDFMSEPDVYRYAMHAFGMEDLIYAKAFVRRALVEGVDARDSFANTLQDSRLRHLVAAFNFARNGEATTSLPAARQGVVDRYMHQVLEEDAGRANEGIRLALYFQRSVGDVSSTYGLLADKALLRVTQVALGLPVASGALDIDRQAALISARLDVGDLREAGKLDKFLTRFVALWDIENPPATAVPELAPFSTAPGFGLGADLLAAIQSTAKRS